jgi:hypothetical protein
MKRIFFLILSCFIVQSGLCQEKEIAGNRILFHGIVLDASTLSPIANSQIIINRVFTSISSDDGTFAFYVNRNDTVIFTNLGYKSTLLYISDTLSGREFVMGIYMNSDTLSIGEVVIIPRFTNLKSEILNSISKTSVTFDNAKYNVAISSYQGRNSSRKLGDPATNYAILTEKQRLDAYERGGIPSDKMLGLSPLLLIPSAYLLLNGLPDKPAPSNSQITSKELDDLNKRYIELLKERSEDKR